MALRLLRAELGRRWLAWLSVALLVGLAGGVVLATATGARRTDTAYPRLVRWSRSADVLISPQNTGLTGYYDALRRLPEVGRFATVVGINLSPVGGTVVAPAVASTDGVLGTAVDRPKLLAGRMYDPRHPDEVLVDRLLAQHLRVRVGAVLHLVAAGGGAPGAPELQPITARVVGIVATPSDILPVDALAAYGQLIATPALYAQLGNAFNGFDGALVRLRPGVSRSAFQRDAQALAAQFPDTGGGVFLADEHQEAAKVERGIRPQAVALGLFSLLTALTALFVVGQLASRQTLIASGDNSTLRAMGITPRQLFALSVSQVGAAATVGAALAVAIGALASRLMPIGPARVAEPHPGLAPNWALLGIGALAIVVLLVARVARPAWRVARSSDGETADLSGRGPSRFAATARRAGAPVTAAIGVQWALEPGRGRTAVPVRSAFAGMVVAIAAVAAALTFGGSLVHLVGTPRLYGQQWDATLDTQFANIPPGDVSSDLGDLRGVQGWTFGDHATLGIGRQEVPAIALAPGRGAVAWPTVLEGRAPERPDEVMLGTKTLAATGLRLGDSVAVQRQGQDAPTPMRIVGRAVFPFFGQGSFAPTDLGEGAAVIDSAPDPAGFNFVLVRFTSGPDRTGAVGRFRRAVARQCPPDNPCNPVLTLRPASIINYSRVQVTPVALAGVLALLAIATLAHLLVTSIRRRRRDLAVLKTLGFVRRQVSAIVAWQASVVVVVPMLIGVPLGVAAGRWTWRVFAGRLGVPSDPRAPLTMLVLAVPLALVVANVIAAGPAWVAGRLRPAPVLRND